MISKFANLLIVLGCYSQPKTRPLTDPGSHPRGEEGDGFRSTLVRPYPTVNW
jgi:hypothetical protein